eukprot:TRINITY_DN3940_c0_g1_i6.p1 TRINITY_DN3940_c0_g1~~TRINITY_DN3940_c0_g1_i6.p1  ORF type:complete len:137 (+),score=29.52 TRINITY_DN3940_c0_g1_i6:145-555(+)
MQRGLVGSEMCIRDRYQRRVHGDLTQMTTGFSRHDSGALISKYVEEGILIRDPFSSIDIRGVGELIKLCIERVKKVNPRIQFCIAGNQASDYTSIEFFSKIGIHALSCSPTSFPVAKIAAAQVALKSLQSLSLIHI